MPNDDELLSIAKKKIEARLGWGNSTDWVNHDFLDLSKKIQGEIGIPISHVTLKRIWGKVKYDSLPNTFTLNILAQFVGYENWRDFKVKNEDSFIIPQMSVPPLPDTGQKKNKSTAKENQKSLKVVISAAILIGVAVCVSLFIIYKGEKKAHPTDYSFSIKKVLKKGLPNSVIFDYDASRAPSDSVIIQQSWDTALRTVVSKNQHQRTLIYYMPGFFKPKLVVNEQIVKEQDLLIQSDGWLTAVQAWPMPIYFRKEDVLANGKMSLSVDKIKAQNISLSPQAPLLFYFNVQDFGEIYSDNFVFETSLKNDYREGSSICQMTTIYLLCEGTAVGIPLCTKGCESAINFFFNDFKVSGKQQDLSSFGVDFNEFVKLRVESAKGKANIFLNDKLCYEVTSDITKSKIIGIAFAFRGTGTVNYVKLSNEEVSFEDRF